jgi:Flp pilus assembly protein TadB
VTDVARRRAQAAAQWRPNVPHGHEWWTDSPHLLAARLNQAAARYEIAPRPDRYELTPHLHGALVRRLRPRPPAWRKPVAVACAVLVVLAGAGWAVAWLLAWLAGFLAKAAAVVAVLFLVWLVRSVAGGHPCRGIHCSGCKG